jgi:hypothetical protein
LLTRLGKVEVSVLLGKLHPDLLLHSHQVRRHHNIIEEQSLLRDVELGILTCLHHI